MLEIWLVIRAGTCDRPLFKQFILLCLIILYGLMAATSIIIGLSLASCSSPVLLGDETPTIAISSPPLKPTNPPSLVGEETQLSNLDKSVAFNFPKEIDPSQRYLFYLHGKIIEDQGLPAISPEYGEYKYEEILETLQSYGFVVISEQRSRDTDGVEYALRVTEQVNKLLNAKVPPGSITVVGASKGAAIATFVSNFVFNREVNYVLLGACHPPLIEEWKQQGISLSGNVLAIYDSFDEYADSCQELFAYSAGPRFGRHDEIILQVGSGHGILYEPLAEWVLPTLHWAKQEW